MSLLLALIGAPPATPQRVVLITTNGQGPLDLDRYDLSRLFPIPAPFIEPPAAWFQQRPLQGYVDPLDPANYSDGGKLLQPPFAPNTVVVIIPGLPMGTVQMMAAAAEAAATSGPGDGGGSRIIPNSRGGGLDGWAWMNG